MTTRRNFLKGVAVSAILVAGSTGRSEAAYTPFAGVIYTSEVQGRWAGKAGSHAPVVTKEGRKVTITTNHPMSEAHYIVRHTLVLADGTVVGDKTFSPSDSKPVSTFMLPEGYSSKFYATSFCNKHDFWLTESM